VNGTTPTTLSLNESAHLHTLQSFQNRTSTTYILFTLAYNISNLLDPVRLPFSSRCPNTPKKGFDPYFIGLRRRKDPSCHHRFTLSLSTIISSSSGELSSTRITRRSVFIFVSATSRIIRRVPVVKQPSKATKPSALSSILTGSTTPDRLQPPRKRFRTRS